MESLDLEPDLAPGTPVGEYLADACIGRGAHGTVYRAHHKDTQKLAAIKVLSQKASADPNASKRFISEARAVNRIGHAHIIDIFAFGELPDGRRYHMMEYLEGQTLQGLIEQRGRLEVSEVITILEPLAGALDAAHSHGIAHRDLKPENIFLVARPGQPPFPKLLDFGIAKLMSSDFPALVLTTTGTALGTPAYMSPEQCRGKDIDHRTDIYSFGIVMFQMLTGRLPFTKTATAQLLLQHLHDTPPSLHELRPELSELVSRVVLGCLAKSRDDRPTSVIAVIEALRRAASGIDPASVGTEAGEESPFAPEPAWKKLPLKWIAIAAIAAVLSAIGYWAVTSSEPETEALSE